MSGVLPFPVPGLSGRPPQPETPPLLDLLGACWRIDVPVVGVSWHGDVAGFGLGDGTLAMARRSWPGAPALAPREGGGTQLHPATAPQPPLSRQKIHQGAILSIATDHAGGFLTGGDDGSVRLTTVAGDSAMLAERAGCWMDLVATSAAGWRAWSSGKLVQISAPGAATHDLVLDAAATAMAFDAPGRRLAVAHYRGVTIWQAQAEPVVLRTKGCPRAVAWSPDGAYLICGLQENALHGWRVADAGAIEMGGYPGQPRSLAFTADGGLLASSGGARVVCWRFDPPQAGSQPLECGLPSSRLPVCAVACHPTHPLVAAGYHNGSVLLCQPGRDDVLFAKGSSGGSVTALAWSPDGQSLAAATQGGEIGVVNLPATLFRFGAGEPSSHKQAS